MEKTLISLTLLVISFLCILLLPSLGQHGLFGDGILYGTLARNLAEGQGSFWKPFFSDFFFKEFTGHPPLAINLQSFFFRVIGDYFWIERGFSFLIVVLTVIGIIRVWQDALPKYKNWYWLPLLFWLSAPIITWCFKQNMLENTVMVFQIFSVWCVQKALNGPKKNYGWLLWLLLSSSCIIGAYLSKGIATIYPIIAVSAYALAFLDFSKKIILKQFLLFLFVIVLLSLLLVTIPDARYNLFASLNAQIGATKIETKDTRWFIVIRLILELLPVLILVVGVFIRIYFKEKNYVTQHKKTLKRGLFWLFIGIAGSFPIMLSTKQSGFYIAPSLMFFTLGLAAFVVPKAEQFLQLFFNKKWLNTGLRIMTMSLFLLAFFLMIQNWNTFNRDEIMINDVKTIGAFTNESKLSIGEELNDDWNMFNYFMRYEHIALDRSDYFNFLITYANTTTMKGYERVDLELKRFHLWEKSKSLK